MRKPLAWYSLRNTGGYALVPPVAVGLLFPIGLAGVYSSNNIQATKIYVESVAVLLIPVLAAWWPVFVPKERIEGDGRELLYFLKRKGEGITVFLLALSYEMLLIPFLLLANKYDVLSASYVPLLLARCFFMAIFAFWASFVFRSSPLALVLVLIFNLGLMRPIEGLFELPWAWSGRIDPSDTVILFYTAVAAGMLFHGEFRSRRFIE